jgi:hypothetical protein
MSEYRFDKWKPNGYLVVIGFLLYSWTILEELNFRQAIFVTLTALSFGWAIGFSKRLGRKE